MIGELFIGLAIETGPRITFRGTPGSEYTRYDDLRGYAFKKSCSARHRILLNDQETVTDVYYHSDKYGLRISPRNDNPDAKVVVFFGCSFAFGESVNDNETLPYLFQFNSNNKYRSYNFAFKGYGPHQMLRIIETGLMDGILPKKPDMAIYLAITLQIDRAAGNYPYLVWDVSGPKYKLNKNNEVEFCGKFMPYRWFSRLFAQLDKSFIFKRLLPKVIGHRRNQDDINLFIAIIKKSRDLWVKKYKAPFYVILFGKKWGNEDVKDFDVVLKGLRENNIDVITTDTIFSRYHDNKLKYIKHKYDMHPSKLAYERIADYLLNHYPRN